jgi:aryl-alcohol dehydrogenase-like predicted oxidoreductase
MLPPRCLGQSELQITTVGPGTWALGGAGWADAWGPQDDRDSITSIRRALDLGVNWIDTAPVYGLGHAEEVVGAAVAGRRDKGIIATKCGLVWTEGSAQVARRLKPWSIRREAEASLRRLRIETIDLYQIHRAEPDEDLDEAWLTIGDLIREGKIRYAGLSNITVQQLRRIHALRPATSVQLRYNMLDRAAEEEMLPFCAACGIGVVVYSPMAAGLLTGAFSLERAARLPKNDWRTRAHEFQEPELSINLEFVETLRCIAIGRQEIPTSLCVSWVLRRPEVTAAIAGARRPRQIEETLGAGQLEFTCEEIAKIDAALLHRARRLGEARCAHR